MKKSDILVNRKMYTKKSCIGVMILGESDSPFCYTLEDVSRGENIKIPAETAIPAGVYKWKVTFSQRFQREMIMIFTEPNGYELKNNGISFKGIRIHGGNTDKNTEGCILTAYKKTIDGKIYQTAEREITAWAKKVGGSGKIYVKNL